MRKVLLLIGLAAVVQLATAGCACMQGGTPCTELERLNADLTARNRALEEGLAGKDTEISGLRAQLNDRDAKLSDLQNRLTSLQNQPQKAEPPAPTPTGATGFEGTGEVTRQGQAVTVTIPADLLFDPGKVTIKNKGSLPKIASVINAQYAGYKVRVRGHTDSNPIVKSGWKDNWDLGFNRARAVALQLMSDGVPEKNIEMDSLADSEPHGGGKAQDRRVEIEVAPPQAGK